MRNLVFVLVVAVFLAGCTVGGPEPLKPDPTYTISGRVTNGNGDGVEGITIGVTGSVSGTATTDSQGRWSYSSAKGVVVVAPIHPGTTFEPTSRTMTEASNDVDFVALGETDVQLIEASGELWWSQGEVHRIDYVAQNMGQAGQYKVEVYGKRVNVVNPPWEYLGSTDLLTIGAHGTQHGLHDLAFQLTLPYRYYTLRIDVMVWTGSNWVQTDSMEIRATS